MTILDKFHEEQVFAHADKIRAITPEDYTKEMDWQEGQGLLEIINNVLNELQSVRHAGRIKRIVDLEHMKNKIMSDEEWIKDLSVDKAYARINVAHEYDKALRWYKENRRVCTRRAFINWLNRVDMSLAEKPKPTTSYTKFERPVREPSEEEIKTAGEAARNELEKFRETRKLL